MINTLCNIIDDGIPQKSIEISGKKFINWLGRKEK